MKDIRSFASFASNAGGSMPVNSNSMSWNADMVTTTGNVVVDLLHNFHLECGARLHKLRVYETLSDPTGREVCGYLLVRGSVHAHAYALALKQITGVELEKFLPTPNIPLDKIPNARSTCRRARIAGFIHGARTTTRKSPASGETASRHCRGIRQGNWRWWMVCPRAAKSISSPASHPPSRRTTHQRKCLRLRPGSTRSRAETLLGKSLRDRGLTLW